MAVTGEQGVEQVDELRPDVVLMDLNLPGIDGLEATRRIIDGHPDITVIVFSTHSPEDYADRAIAAGAVGFLPKADFGPDTLAETRRPGGPTITRNRGLIRR